MKLEVVIDYQEPSREVSGVNTPDFPKPLFGGWSDIVADNLFILHQKQQESPIKSWWTNEQTSRVLKSTL